MKPDSDETKQQSFFSGRVIVALLLFVFYPLSLGPAAWLNDRVVLPEFVWLIYQPLFLVLAVSPEPVKDAASAYCDWWLS